MLEESRDVLLRRRQQHAMPRLDELGKRIQVAEIRLASERAQPFLHAQIGLIVLQKRRITLNIHTFDYLRVASSAADSEKLPNHVHQGIKSGNIIQLEIISGDCGSFDLVRFPLGLGEKHFDPVLHCMEVSFAFETSVDPAIAVDEECDGKAEDTPVPGSQL